MANYFDLFGLPVRFTLDEEALASSYRELQKAAHPDRFAHQGEQSKRVALQKTAQINDAFATLKTPLSRAEYMLSLIGVDLKAEQSSMRDTAFLMQQMAWRETLEALKHQGDIDALEAFSREIAREEQTHIASIAQAFDSDDYQEQSEKWANEVRKLAFLNKLGQEIVQAEEALDDY